MSKNKRTFLSVLRQSITNLFPTGETAVTDRSVVRRPAVSIGEDVFEYANQAREDVKLLRSLYRNTNNKYVLGAHLVKPIIDSNTSFIGVPTIHSTNKRTKKTIDSFVKDLPFHAVHRISEREGTSYVWPQINKDGSIRFEVMRPECVKTVCINPITKDVDAYILKDYFTYNDKNDVSHSIDITTVVSATEMRQTIVADRPELSGTKIVKNIFGFIPIVPFKNDAEAWDLFGHSEIENIEPTIKLYHDVTLEAARSQRRDGHPKMVVKARDVKDWVDRNYGDGTYELLRSGSAKLSLEDRDLYICETSSIDGEESEDVKYVEANRTTGEYQTISEKTFTNIIEGGQVPEIVFGANMGAALASVKEQRPSYIKKIEKKQLQYEKQWRKLIEVSLIMKGIATFETVDAREFYFVWPTPDFSSEKEKADTLNVLSTALIKMRAANIIGDEEIHETIKRFDIIQVKQGLEEHMQDVEKTAEVMLERVKDEAAIQNNRMNQRVADGSYDNGAETKDDAEDDDAEKAER